MYKLVFSNLALKQLNKLEKNIKERIWEKLQLCKENPFRFLEHLEQIKGFKLRVGDYRLIIDVNISAKILEIAALICFFAAMANLPGLISEWVKIFIFL